MEYLYHLVILICIYLILAQSFNLCFGLSGLFNLAHIALYAIGAYITALLSTQYGFGAIECLILSIIGAGVFSFLLAVIAHQLSEDYFAIGSLAFSSVVVALLMNWKSLTRGVLGITGIPRPEVFGSALYENFHFMIFTLVVTSIALTLMSLVFQSPLGRTLQALSEFELGAIALGKNTAAAKSLIFICSAMGAGLAGSLFAYYINYIDPSSFQLSEMVFVVTIVILGRPGSFLGTCIATVFLILLPEALRFVPLAPGVLGPLRQLLYAVVLLVVLYLKRELLFPKKRLV